MTTRFDGHQCIAAYQPIVDHAKTGRVAMRATVWVKCPGNRTLLKTLDIEIKGPFYTGNVVTFLAGMTGKVIQKFSDDAFEVQVEPSDYTRCKEEFGFEPKF